MTSTEKKNCKKRNSSEVRKLQVRHLKIYPHYRQSRYSRSVVPELRLVGCWLEEAGFIVEEHVTVIVTNGMLVIRSAETK